MARKPGTQAQSDSPAVDHDVIRELAQLLDETGLTEIEYQRDGTSIRVARHVSAPAGRAWTGDAPPAPRSGTVTQILVETGQPVEFGEPLMIIE